MKRCNQKSKEKSQALMNQEVQENVDQTGVQLPRREGRIVDRNANELIREIDAQSNETEAVKNAVKIIGNG